MLRTNLATRPFYNERGVHLLLGLAALLVLVLTAFNAYRIVSLSRHNTELSSRVNQDRREAARLTQDAAKIRRGINQAELNTIVAAAQEANALIDQRTFSWTQFFNRIEATLPPDVMLTAVTPSFDAETTIIAMSVLARRPEDIDEFVEQLEKTGAFKDVLPAQGDVTEAGLHRANLKAVYTATDEPIVPVTQPAAATSGVAR
jgi:Tfp pilus assembly protein PilN